MNKSDYSPNVMLDVATDLAENYQRHARQARMSNNESRALAAYDLAIGEFERFRQSCRDRNDLCAIAMRRITAIQRERDRQ